MISRDFLSSIYTPLDPIVWSHSILSSIYTQVHNTCFSPLFYFLFLCNAIFYRYVLKKKWYFTYFSICLTVSNTMCKMCYSDLFLGSWNIFFSVYNKGNLKFLRLSCTSYKLHKKYIGKENSNRLFSDIVLKKEKSRKK